MTDWRKGNNVVTEICTHAFHHHPLVTMAVIVAAPTVHCTLHLNGPQWNISFLNLFILYQWNTTKPHESSAWYQNRIESYSGVFMHVGDNKNHHTLMVHLEDLNFVLFHPTSSGSKVSKPGMCTDGLFPSYFYQYVIRLLERLWLRFWIETDMF